MHMQHFPPAGRRLYLGTSRPGPAGNWEIAARGILRDAAHGRTWTVVLELFLFSDSQGRRRPDARPLTAPPRTQQRLCRQHATGSLEP